MKGWKRRIRGALGMGLTWGAAWFGAGMLMMLGFLVTTGSTGADVPYPLGFGMLGFLAGTTFSGVLGLVAGRRRFNEISLPKFTGLGALGGLLLSTLFVITVTLVDDPGFMSNLLVLAPVFSAAGAACSGAALTLARRAERKMLESGETPYDWDMVDERTPELIERG